MIRFQSEKNAKAYATDTTNGFTSTTYRFSRGGGNSNVPGDPDLEPSFSDSSSNKYTSPNDTNSSKSKNKKRDRKKKHQKYKKHDLSEPSSVNNSDLSYNSDYRRKQIKRKRNRKNYPIKLCARLTAKLLTTVYKSIIIKFKLD